jgi:hypothetical protein
MSLREFNLNITPGPQKHAGHHISIMLKHVFEITRIWAGVSFSGPETAKGQAHTKVDGRIQGGNRHLCEL